MVTRKRFYHRTSYRNQHHRTVDDDVGLLVSLEEATVLLVERGDVERHARVQRRALLSGTARRLR